MTRNKHQKKSSVPANVLPSDREMGRKKGGSSAGGSQRGESLDGNGELARRKGRKAKVQAKYYERYDYLFSPEQGHGSEGRRIQSTAPATPTGNDRDSTPRKGQGIWRAKDSPLSSTQRNRGTPKPQTQSSLGSHSYNNVNFTYEDMGSSRESGGVGSAQVDSAMDTSSEVVLPASDGQVEVVVDRKGSLLRSWPNLQYENTLGLAYFKDETAGLGVERSVEERSLGPDTGHCIDILLAKTQQVGDINSEVVLPASDGQVEVVIDRKGSLLTSWPNLQYENTRGLGYVEEEGPGLPVEGSFEDRSIGEDTVNSLYPRTQQVGDPCMPVLKRHARFPKRTSRVNESYLSVGGLKIFTSDMPTTSDGEASGTGIVNKGFEDEDDRLQDWGMLYSGGKKRNGKSRKARIQGYTSCHPISRSLAHDLSDEGDRTLLGDSDFSDELVDDYVANCEGLSADLNDPNWVRWSQHSLGQVAIEDESLQETNYRGNETASEEDLDKENDSSDSQSENSEDLSMDGGSDIDRDDLAEKMFFSGSSSNSSEVGNQGFNLPFLDNEERMRTLELDEISYLPFEDKTHGINESEGPDQDHRQKKSLRKQNHAPRKSSDLYETQVGTSYALTKDVFDMASTATPIWPMSRGGRRTKKSKCIPGQKKQERRETIAMKRRDRAVHRGFDIIDVNKVLEDFVMKKKDIVAFEPMKQQDRAQVHRIAKLYRLKSGSQGTTKRRFVVISCTASTALPSGDDKVRLLKLLGLAVKTPSRPDSSRANGLFMGDKGRAFQKMKSTAHQALHGMQPSSRRGILDSSQSKTGATIKGRSRRPSKGVSSSKEHRTIKVDNRTAVPKTAVVYANNPVSFTSRGTIHCQEDWVSSSRVGECSATIISETLPETSSRIANTQTSTKPDFAFFEAHTKGFGSRMMVKMGFMEGLGLGRDKQGIAEPVEAVKRPKSLGLGAFV